MADINREDLEDAFRKDPQFGIEVLHTFFQSEIAGYIKFVGHGALNDHDIADIYQDVIMEMIEAVKKPTFDPNEPMRLVYRIAFTNTKEYLRNRSIHSAANLDDCLEFLATDLEGTDVQLRWRYLTRDKQRDFNNALFEIVSDLPEMQRITAIVFITRYKQIRGRNLFTPVAEGIKEFSGKDITAAAAKRNWHEARKKIAEELIKRGFDIFSPE